MLTKLIFTDGIEIIHEDCYPYINPNEDTLDISNYETCVIEASYELNLVDEIIFSNQKEE